jgi:RNA polymerase sigma-70 factor, ECF subfamily
MSTERSRQEDPAEDPQHYERFVRLFAQVRDNLFAYVFSLLPHWSDAEDVFQQTSLVLWRKFAEFQPDSDFLAWACKTAYYEVCNFRRTASRNRLRFNDALLEQLAEERDVSPQRESRRRDFLMDCIAKLTDDQRLLLSRAYEGEATIRELAEELRRSPQTLYNRLSNIRRVLFDCVETADQRQEGQP